jgi:RND family efflux transporter MFP subunit
MITTRVKLGGLLSVFALVSCGESPRESAPPVALAVPPGTSYVVADTLLTEAIMASGVAEPMQRSVLATKLMARVTSVLVQEGDRIAAGQVLIRLDARELEAKGQRVAAGLSAAEASWRDAEQHVNRMRALWADSAAPKAQLDQAEAAAARAEAGVREARAAGAELEAVGDYATIRAPYAGVVTRRLIESGALAGPGQPLLEVEEQTQLRIVVTAAPDVVRGLRAGQRLPGTISGRAVTAVVEGIVPAPGGNLATVNAIVPNRDGIVFSGSSATLALPQGSRTGRVVPAAAIVREGDLTGLRIRRAGAWELRWVRLGAEDSGRVEILTGVLAGDTVLVPDGSR